MNDDDIVPFPVLWQVELAPAMTHDLAPLLVGDGVIIRSRLTITCLDEATGRTRWSFALPADAGGGCVLARAGELIVVDAGTSLRALTLDGREAWRAEVGRVPEQGVAIAHGRVYALSFASPFDETLVGFSAATGDEEVRVHLAGGFAGIVASADGLVLRRHSVSDDRGGLIALDRDGGSLRTLEPGACWALAAHGDRVAAITRGPDEAPRVALYRRFEPAWSLPIERVGLAFDGDDVVAFVEGGIALVGADGTECWRAAPEPDDDAVDQLALVGPLVYQPTYGAGSLRRRRDGRALGAYLGFGPPVARGDRLFLHTPTGAMCASLAGV